jgi:hypothetical protein
MHSRFYDTDLTNAAWARVAPVLPAARPGGRPRLSNQSTLRNRIGGDHLHFRIRQNAIPDPHPLDRTEEKLRGHFARVRDPVLLAVSRRTALFFGRLFA